MTIEIPKHLLKSPEWRAALLLLANTPLKRFFNPQYVNFTEESIDLPAMRRDCASSSSECLADLAAHLFNVWRYKTFPGEGLYNLDYNNKCVAFVAMMFRHEVDPQDVAALAKEMAARVKVAGGQ